MDKDIELMYQFNDFCEESEKSLDEQEPPERPVCDSLSEVDDRYSGFTEIARGGMKRIYKVFDSKINRYVAYAKLHPNSPRELHDPFVREARLTALLEHPNIISVHDIGITDEDTPYFTMELKPGQSLAKLVSENMKEERGGMNKPEDKALSQDKSSDFIFHTSSFRNSVNQLLEMFLKVCDAISYAHSKNVIHLDLKPDNVQIGEFGEVIVCDWGLGKIIGDKDIEGLELSPIHFSPAYILL